MLRGDSGVRLSKLRWLGLEYMVLEVILNSGKHLECVLASSFGIVAIRVLGDVRKAMLALHQRVIVCEQTFQAFRDFRLPVSNVGEEFRFEAIGRNSEGINTV